MKVAGSEAEHFRQVFDRALKEGDRYVCINTGNIDRPFPAEAMCFFKDKPEALYYSYAKRSEENECVEALPVLSVQEQLCKKIELQQLTRPSGQELKDISIDTGHIHYMERARQEVFIEEISKQLRDRNIKIDQKQLQGYISNDFEKFFVKGMKWERGDESPCIVQIEQNKSRAFLIGSVRVEFAKDQRIEREDPRNRVLTGKLSMSDAVGLKNVLKTERDNGNYYAVIPGGKGALKKEDFSFFRSVFDAWEYIGQKSNADDKYIFRSISLLKDEVEQQLDTKKEKEELPEQKRQRGKDLSQER